MAKFNGDWQIKLNPNLPQELTKANEKMAQKCENEMKTNSPVGDGRNRFGHLKDNWYHSTEKSSIGGKAKAARVRNHKYQILHLIEFGSKNNQADPFMRKSVQNTKKEFKEVYSNVTIFDK